MKCILGKGSFPLISAKDLLTLSSRVTGSDRALEMQTCLFDFQRETAQTIEWGLQGPYFGDLTDQNMKDEGAQSLRPTPKVLYDTQLAG